MTSNTGTSSRLMLKSIIEQFMLQKHELDIEPTPLNLSEAVQELMQDVKPSKIPDYDIERLVLWTQHQLSIIPNLKLVLLIPDYESLESNLMQTLILIFSDRKHQIPITFLMGVGTCIDILHQSLPAHVISLLKIEKFHLSTATKCVDLMVKKV